MTEQLNHHHGPQLGLPELTATTLHRLLGWRRDPEDRYRHGPVNRLPYDVVVIDETSMVSLTMMARVIEALRPNRRVSSSATQTSWLPSTPAQSSQTSSPPPSQGSRPRH